MELADSRPLWLADVMVAIATFQSTLTAKIEAVQMDVGLILQDMDKLLSRVTETEQRIGQTEDDVPEQSAALCTFQTKVKALEYRAKDTKNRNRRNNLCIIGLPEGAERENPTGFVEDMLCTLLPDARFSPHYNEIWRCAGHFLHMSPLCSQRAELGLEALPSFEGMGGVGGDCCPLRAVSFCFLSSQLKMFMMIVRLSPIILNTSALHRHCDCSIRVQLLSLAWSQPHNPYSPVCPSTYVCP